MTPPTESHQLKAWFALVSSPEYGKSVESNQRILLCYHTTRTEAELIQRRDKAALAVLGFVTRLSALTSCQQGLSASTAVLDPTPSLAHNIARIGWS